MKKRTIVVTNLLAVALVAPDALAEEASQPQELVELRDELLSSSREEALGRLSYYRPLCDAEGYPLVGNVIRKVPTYQPSDFCKDVREREKRTSTRLSHLTEE